VAQHFDGRELEVAHHVDGVAGAIDGVFTGVNLARVGGCPRRFDRAPAPALVSDRHVCHTRSRVAGRPLGDDGILRGEPLVDGVACTDAADLLADERRDNEFAVGAGLGVPERTQRRRECAFHVRTAAAAQPAVVLVYDVAVVAVHL